MKKIILLIIIGLAALVYIFRSQLQRRFFEPAASVLKQEQLPEQSQKDIETVARGLNIPWEVVFLPTGEMLVTERPGTLLKIGRDKKTIPIQGVKHTGEGGLLGLALHPDFSDNHWIYLYLTTNASGALRNRVERYRLDGEELTDRTVILENIPGAQFHDGGRLAFGPASAEASAGKPDYYLFITTGDAGNEAASQDKSSLAGKILRLRDDGSVPADNPFGNAVYSYGHRNPQGLAWDGDGRLFATEHGPSGAETGNDEVNLIEKGKNYGWPVIRGAETSDGMEAPIIESGKNETWAPASAVRLDDKIIFTGLRGESIYIADISRSGGQARPELKNLRALFRGQYGRLRAAVIGPDNFLYISTSNTDGRGSVREGDDKIIRINPDILGVYQRE